MYSDVRVHQTDELLRVVVPLVTRKDDCWDVENAEMLETDD
jgi:hypothetical protein